MSAAGGRWQPRVTVAAVVARDDRYLIVEERVHGRTVYNQPAGHLEPGEGLVAAVMREALEETATAIEPTALLGLYRWSPDGGETTFLRAAFSARVVADHPERPLDAPIVRRLWCTREELAGFGRRLRSPLVLRCVDDHERGVRYPLEALVDIA